MYLIIAGIIACLTFSFKTETQPAIVVAESTLKIGALGEEVFYYGFAEGDQLIFDFEEVNGKELKEIEIIELPSSSKYMDYKSKKIENKTIAITQTGIYKFRFSNSAISGRVCKFKIQRIPANEGTKGFNTSVYWRTLSDTTFFTEQEKYLVKADTSFSDFYSSNPQISSQNALNGNKNYQVLDFVIPDNTVSWSFYIGTGKKGSEEYDKSRDAFLKTTASAAVKIPGYGAMAALALTGVSYFGKVQGEDNVKYWFLNDANSAAQFQAGLPFTQYKKGDVINEACQMKYPLSGKVYLALLNDNTMDVLTVTIKATAVIVKEQWGTRPVVKQKITTRQEPYLKN